MESSFYSKFLKLSGLALDREFPPAGTLSDEELTAFEANLSTMDEQHLGFAITLLAHHAPVRLLPHLYWMLGDLRTGVWTAAERSILLLPKTSITPQVRSIIQAAVQKRCGNTGDSWILSQLANG